MINQELYYDILQKKYNVLKKNLIIIEQNEEKINEFKNTIIELDKMEQDKFKKELIIKKELTTNLDDEYKRLYDYINLIEERNKKRNVMLEDYSNIVKDNINNLEVIEDYDNIDFYKKRLEDINEYLTNDKKYEKYIEEREEYNSILSDYELKCKSLKNIINDFELNLLIKLKNIINSNSIYEKLDFDNIDESIDNYSKLLKEKEKELTTYLNSFKALINSNITNEEKEVYNDFIIEEKNAYLDLLEKKYILLIYKYINSNNLEETLKVYEERLNKINIYELSDNLELKKVFEIINDFILKKENLNEIELTIESIKNNIEQVNAKLEEIIKKLNKVNIVTLLKEFCIEKEYIANNNIESNYETIESDENFIIENEIISEEDKELLKSDNNEKNSEVISLVNLDTNDVKETELVKEDLNDESNDENIEIIDLDNNIDALKFKAIGESENELENEKNDEDINYLDNEIFTEELNKEEDITNIDNIDLNEKEEDNELDHNIKINDINLEVTEKIEYKDNAIIEVKDLNSILVIEEIRQKALNIMKAVCESVI